MQKPVNIKNKKAKFEYEILDTYTAGIVLTGTEIKSITYLVLKLRKQLQYDVEANLNAECVVPMQPLISGLGVGGPREQQEMWVNKATVEWGNTRSRVPARLTWSVDATGGTFAAAGTFVLQCDGKPLERHNLKESKRELSQCQVTVERPSPSEMMWLWCFDVIIASANRAFKIDLEDRWALLLLRLLNDREITLFDGTNFLRPDRYDTLKSELGMSDEQMAQV